MKPHARQVALDRHFEAGRRAADSRDWARAATAFKAAVALAPGDALLHVNLARACLRAGRWDDAIRAARTGHRLAPDDALACRMLAECLVQQHRHAEAAAAFDALPADAPLDFDSLMAKANALLLSNQPLPAVDVLMRAIALKLDDALAHYRLGLAFRELRHAKEASECFRTAAALDDGAVRALTLSLLVHESRQACDWSTLAQDTQALLDVLAQPPEAGAFLLSPFALLPIESTPAQQRMIGQRRAHSLTRGVVPLPPPPRQRRPGPLRIGYLSSDFCRHATAVLMVEMLERHDRSRVEVFFYSHSVEDGSDVQQRIRAAADHYLDVTHMDNAAVARRMRADGIDVAVDLKGHTRDSRFELLAWRPAPVQVSFLGYPATTGADFIDYVVGDRIVTPLEHGGQYSERIAQLPHSYQPNDARRPLPPAPVREALGLPADAVVLCCFNQTYKLSPRMLDLWARILARAPRAVLWLLAWNPHATLKLRAELEARGVAAERVFFAPKRELADHIARLRAADLFLDTWPCNAHTTGSEALWAGVPLMTVPGPTFASRVGASLAHACGLGELACTDEEAYVEQAVALANDAPRLHAMKARLEADRGTLPLFDSARFARDFERLLERMVARWQAGEPPAPLAADTDA